MASPINIDTIPPVRVFPDFPEPGVAFQDLAPLYAEPGLLARLGDALVEPFAGAFDTVLALEARGFVIGTAVAAASRSPLVLARKAGKLPGALHRSKYALEYGSAELTVQHGALPPGARVLLVDDVLATGGTMAAAAELARQSGATVAGCGVILELVTLGGRKRLAPNPVTSLLTVP
ncbi:adenine phosphoribosyltransferase [Paractinoplanes deccanensis]|uniref:Adenine phosphoribosyltransferase n=1 Tax=Paractinoplanes deccanensis TaxID=113561 RepID=A0ABQ3YKA2_9ACTN|nr:adenine phosphoribosyltransferase [Actinoplanes deccanensis]GID80220.1 adenine phosphoribosyltransferase [Actinoplanes deccanensis]